MSSMNNDADLDKPATKRDLRNAIREMREFILEREIVAMRWVIGIQLAYFFGTLVAVWFLVTHH